MSALVAANSWGLWVGCCTECRETVSGNRTRVELWADVHNSDNHKS